MRFDYLRESPYNCKLNTKDDLTLVKYTIDTDWAYNKAVMRHYRGCVFNAKCDLIHLGLDKFWNLTEAENDVVPQFPHCRVMAKIDGSNVSAWFYAGAWHWSSLSCVDAHDAVIANSGISLYDIIALAVREDPCDWAKAHLDPNFSYVFEVTSPYNRIIIDYGATPQLWGITKRSHITWRESPIESLPCVREIPTFSFASLNDCIAIVQQMQDDEEGYVVINPDYSRVKIKSPTYIARHHMANNGIFGAKQWLMMRRADTLDDYLAAFPDKRPQHDIFSAQFDTVCASYDAAKAQYRGMSNRDIAALNIDKNIKSFVLSHTNTAAEWLDKRPLKNVINLLEGVKI